MSLIFKIKKRKYIFTAEYYFVCIKILGILLKVPFNGIPSIFGWTETSYSLILKIKRVSRIKQHDFVNSLLNFVN